MALGFYLGVPFIEKVLSYVPDFITHGLDIAAGIIPAIGFAMLARMMVTKDDSISIIRLFIRCLFKNFSSGDCFVWHRDCPTIYEYE